MIDPLLTKAIALGFAVLFIGAAWHKLSGVDRFEAILSEYRLLPTFMNRTLAMLIPVIELLLGVGWISGLQPRTTAMVSAALLATYALALGINLVRGRIFIDCG
ncbi:MAG: DoxX family membrane protein [Proteobacteria bacterium]|nr:DoxX family membrane protein [Pseudomonadota bacterium]